MRQHQWALDTKTMQEHFNEGIIHVITRRHAHFVERFIRTLNEALHNRIDNERDKHNIPCTDYICAIMLTYNNELKHYSHGFTPADAAKRENSMDAIMNLEMKAKKKQICKFKY